MAPLARHLLSQKKERVSVYVCEWYDMHELQHINHKVLYLYAWVSNLVVSVYVYVLSSHWQAIPGVHSLHTKGVEGIIHVSITQWDSISANILCVTRHRVSIA